MAATHPVAQLVVIGSSAGGIEALSTLVATLPPDFGAPIVIAQHLDPTRPSHLSEILARHTPLPVRTVTDHAPLVPGVIFVTPPNAHVAVTGGALRLHPESVGRHKPSIDLLFSTAAAAYGEHLIAVILSGTGSDGAAGAHAVKQAGGVVVIQDPQTAAFPGMPRSLAPTTVDMEVSLHRLGAILTELLAGQAAQPHEREALTAFLAELRERYGLDFSQYKPPTIMRRLQRRILATDTESLVGYRTYLQTHPTEYQQLVKAFLIKVTEFFRDPDLFAYLREAVLPDLLTQARKQGNSLRCWSAGCATGEEAYSLAILVAEALGSEVERFTVRIFATDADAEAVAFARRGIYPTTALAKVPEALRDRYFTREDHQYVAKKRLRSLMVFGQHDLAQRAPFPHLDLVLCRNVLIYFTSELQQRTLHLFTYALREGGVLVLGKAESVGPVAEFFQMHHKQHKVFRRRGNPLPFAPTPFTIPPVPHEVSVPQRSAKALAQQAGAATTLPSRTLQEQSLLTLPVGVVVVNRRYAIQAINLAARRFCSIHGPALGDDLIHLVHGVPIQPLRTAIDTAFRTGEVTTLAEVTLEQVTPGAPHSFQISAHPQRSEGEPGPVETISLVIADVTAAVIERSRLQQELQATTQELEQLKQTAAQERERMHHEAELAVKGVKQEARAEAARREVLIERLVETNRQVLEANQALSSAGEELRTTNEALAVGHEEAQAAVEEMETLNEEYQASNEEMETLNEELQATVEELNTTNADLQARSLELQDLAHTSQAERAQLAAILQSMGDAVLVVNRAAQTLLTNAAYSTLFGHADAVLVAHDQEGRPLAAEAQPHQRAARGETFILEFTLPAEASEQRSVEATGQPIHDEEGQQQGGVIVIRDITERSLHRLQDAFLSLASHELRTPLTSLSGALQLLLKHLAKPPLDAETLRAYAERALRQCKRLGGLVNDLNEVTRLHQGKYTLHPERVSLQGLVAQTVEVAQLTTTSHTIQLKLTSEPLVVLGDAGRLEQVLLNLLSNAIRYVPANERIVVRLERAGHDALLQVEDTGPGIPAADLPHLFTRFYQGAHPSERAGHGLGLGLYITRELVVAHGGRIGVESVEGQGTIFSIALPLLEDATEPVHSRSAARPSSAE